MYKPTDFDMIENLAATDAAILKKKDNEYGSSWRRRGGVGAFMMLARKWDRIEQQASETQYDIFNACDRTGEDFEGVLDTIADLRRYLLLVEEHVRAHYDAGPECKHLDTKMVQNPGGYELVCVNCDKILGGGTAPAPLSPLPPPACIHPIYHHVDRNTDTVQCQDCGEFFSIATAATQRG